MVKKMAAVALAALILGMTACSGSNSTTSEPVPDGPSPTESELKTITIGYLDDMTGPSASALELVRMALRDAVDHCNRERLIPGVEVKVVMYDSQFDPARTIPGYEWLMQRGADFILTAVPSTPDILKPRADAEHVVVFALTANLEELMPPGWVFSMGTIPQYEAYTLLHWIAENDWDYTARGPARVGGAAWDEPYAKAFLTGMKEYAEANPQQFEWVAGRLTNFSFTWGSEVVALKDCDYVSLPTPPQTFARDYRAAGYEARFMSPIPNSAFMGLIDDADAWGLLDGALFLYPGKWWNESGEEIDLFKKVLYENHPDEAEEIIRRGSGYIGYGSLSKVLEIVGNAVEETGPEGFNSEALYRAAESYVDYKDGLEIASFSDTKRYAVNYYGVFEISAAEQDLIRIDPKDYRQLTEP